MGKLSFADNKGDVKPPATKKAAAKKAPSKKKAASAKEEEEKQEVVETDHNPPALPPRSGANALGEFDAEDVEHPRLNLINPLSPLKKELDDVKEGQFVLAKSVILSGPLEVVPLFVVKQFQQSVPFGGDVQANIFNTKQEVLDAGGTLEWSKEAKDNMTLYTPLGHVALLVKAPEGLDKEAMNFFPEEFDGDFWAKVKMTIGGGGYRYSIVKLITQLHNKLKELGLHRSIWQLDSLERSNAQGTWWVPTLKMGGIIDDKEAVVFLEEMRASVDPAAVANSDEQSSED